MQLFEVDTLSQAREKISAVFPKESRKKEKVSLMQALGRVTSEDVYAKENVPDFSKSTVDGYAVHAADTQGAGESIPVILHLVEEVQMGEAPVHVLESGECAYVPTGAMLPEGADAMVMIEHTEPFQEDIAVYQSVSEGRNVIQRGEDVSEGTKVLQEGTLIRPQEVAILASIGVQEVEVYTRLKVAVISTGDELLEAGEASAPAKIRESNGIMLCALAEQNGMQIEHLELVKDDPQRFESLLEQCKKTCDIIISSGGSSKGKRDMTADCFERVASSGILIHGIALKPGKPTIFAYDEDSQTMFFGLPGHPVAAMVVFKLLVEWLNRDIVLTATRNTNLLAEMGSNVAGAPGRETCQLVHLEQQGDRLIAWPVYGKSGIIMSMVQSDGYVMMDLNLEGLKKGQQVEVHAI